MICPRCGKNNDDREYRFCVNCGAPLSSSPNDATLVLPDRGPDNGARTPADRVRVGQVLDGNYRLDSVLGKGTTGTVYRATRLKFSDEVAVKLIEADGAADAAAGERFRGAAQLVVRLKHPGAVTLYDFGVTADGSMYLVTELVEGRTLREIINEQRALEIKLVAEINSQVCSALDEAHRLGIVHGDIKPDNVVVRTSAGGIHVKVLDFGVTKIRSLMLSDPEAVALGNPRYFSPEECMGEPLDGRSDIYSWGIVLYEMLSGTVPFSAPTPTAQIVQKVTQSAPPLRNVNPQISPAVEAVVMSSLNKEREARPRLASLLAQQLDRAVYGGQENQVTAVAPAPAPPSVVTQVRSANPAVEVPFAASGIAAAPSERFATAGSDTRSTQAVPAAKKRSRSSWLIAGAAVLIIAIGVVAGIVVAPMFLSQGSGNKNGGDQNQGNKNQTTPTPTPETTADSEFNQLREKLLNATPAQRNGVRQELVAAEKRYPDDFRFPYLRAKILIDSGQEHIDAFQALYAAGRKAIAADKSDEMLADLERDGSTSFSRLTDHKEWRTLLAGLKDKDASVLELTGHLH